jgi:hypothetical protein
MILWFYEEFAVTARFPAVEVAFVNRAFFIPK